MIISRLEIHGFKSFADKISLDFRQGVTAVVGPNGCGKSNIVDAIRWVMGEQSAKTLRGKLMEDIIFGGSEFRKPLGLAEVSLVFSTEDGRVPAKYLNFSEIQVTRRLYRDGESEYLLNGTSCRLMDISELFMDTGAGAKAYSIIEQGKIGMILNSKPEERRLIIEEAAGVTKFKARKQVALKKIDATKQNLLRVGDIISEIRRQMNSLQRQAKKAEKFKEYREELRDIELLFAVKGYAALAEDRKLLERELSSFRESSERNAREIEVCGTGLDEKKISLLETEKSLNQAQEETYRIRGEITGIENRIVFERKEQSGIGERLLRFSQELAALGERVVEAEVELGRQEELGRNLAVAQSAEDEGLQGVEAHLERLSEEEQILARRLDERRRELFAVLSEISQFTNQHTAAAKRLEILREQLERNRREAISVHEKLVAGVEKVAELDSTRRDLTENRTELESTLASLRVRETALRTALEEADRAFQNERDRLSKQASRLHSLQELEAQFAGYGQGVRTICRAEKFAGRLMGVVADILEVTEEYEVALEAVLSERLQYVICESESDAREAVAYLRENSGGRCSFILKDVHACGEKETPEGTVRLLDRISVRSGNGGIAELLLGSTFLAENLDVAVTLGRKHPGLTFVTLDGETISGGGVFHGGSLDAARQGLIHKKRQIKELTNEVESLTVRVAGRESERARLRNELRTTEESAKAARQDLHRTEIQLVNAEKDLQRAREECQRFEERLAVKEMEDGQLHEELEALEKEIARTEREKSVRESGKVSMESELSSLQNSLADKQREIGDTREIVTTGKVRSASLREQQESCLRTVQRIVESVKDLHARRLRLESELENGTREKERIAALLTADEAELKTFLARQQNIEDSCAAIRARYEAEAIHVREGEIRLKELRSEGEGLARSLGERNLKLSEITLRMRSLEETVAEKYRGPITSFAPKYQGLDFKEDERRARKEELLGLIEGIGEVNLTAIEEFREFEERFEFLSGQKTDLEESLHGLQQAIQRINRTTRKRFLDTFLLVNEKFQAVFPRLFCGGRAELRLTNEEDLLETGIEIIIQPPGKKLQNVNLLSGGEKALTAVALMFAIFLIKPAPFCLLDEVDAPLDEANIGRFNEMVREMSAFSQFIIITHNKATMTNSDCLYGVTMEEPGVSKLVSVKLH